MKIKNILALLVSVIMLCAVVGSPFSAFAIVTADSGELKAFPGNTQSLSPTFSLAWLDNIVVRDDASSIIATTVVPKAEYPYSRTYDEFIREVGRYAALNNINEQTVGQSYEAVFEVLYYAVTALGMTGNQENMRVYLRDYGIKLPANATASENIQIAVVYAALKYNALYVLYEKQVEFPKGISLGGASAIILSEITGTKLPSGIDTIAGFGMLCIKNYVSQFEQLPISENPDVNEIFYWAKIVTAASNDYNVPLERFDEVTQAQKDYVDYAYYASIFNTVYDVKINPIYLAMADSSAETNAIASLILRSMLDEKKTAYDSSADSETLFKLACESGCFKLEDEFYSDVFNYDVRVDRECEKLWFTPFALADQIDGDNKYVSIMLGDRRMAPSETSYAPLDPSESREQVSMIVNYDDGKGKKDSVTYTFNVIKVNEPDDEASENELLNKVQEAVNSVVPQDNEKVATMIDKIFSSIDSKLTTAPTEDGKEKNVLSTYPQGDVTVPSADYADDNSDGIDFDYLDELFGNTYPTDENGNIVTDDLISAKNPDGNSDADESFVEKTVAAIRENPEVAVAAPTSIITVGGFAGYLLSKKRKNESAVKDESEIDDEP